MDLQSNKLNNIFLWKSLFDIAENSSRCPKNDTFQVQRLEQQLGDCQKQKQACDIQLGEALQSIENTKQAATACEECIRKNGSEAELSKKIETLVQEKTQCEGALKAIKIEFEEEKTKLEEKLLAHNEDFQRQNESNALELLKTHRELKGKETEMERQQSKMEEIENEVKELLKVRQTEISKLEAELQQLKENNADPAKIEALQKVISLLNLRVIQRVNAFNFEWLKNSQVTLDNKTSDDKTSDEKTTQGGFRSFIGGIVSNFIESGTKSAQSVISSPPQIPKKNEQTVTPAKQPFEKIDPIPVTQPFDPDPSLSDDPIDPILPPGETFEPLDDLPPSPQQSTSIPLAPFPPLPSFSPQPPQCDEPFIWKKIKERGDGNCGYRMVARHVYGDPNEHRRVRNEIADYIQSINETSTSGGSLTENEQPLLDAIKNGFTSFKRTINNKTRTIPSEYKYNGANGAYIKNMLQFVKWVRTDGEWMTDTILSAAGIKWKFQSQETNHPFFPSEPELEELKIDGMDTDEEINNKMNQKFKASEQMAEKYKKKAEEAENAEKKREHENTSKEYSRKAEKYTNTMYYIFANGNHYDSLVLRYNQSTWDDNNSTEFAQKRKVRDRDPSYYAKLLDSDLRLEDKLHFFNRFPENNKNHSILNEVVNRVVDAKFKLDVDPLNPKILFESHQVMVGKNRQSPSIMIVKPPQDITEIRRKSSDTDRIVNINIGQSNVYETYRSLMDENDIVRVFGNDDPKDRLVKMVRLLYLIIITEGLYINYCGKLFKVISPQKLSLPSSSSFIPGLSSSFMWLK